MIASTKRYLWAATAIFLIAGLVISLIFAGFQYREHGFVAEVRIQIVKKGSRKAIQDDLLASIIALIQSPDVIERAVKKFQLADRGSLKGSDPVVAISSMITASRIHDPDRNAEVIEFRCFAANRDDAEAILLAFLDGCQEFLDLTYGDRDSPRQMLVKAADNLMNDRTTAKGQLEKLERSRRALGSDEALDTQIANLRSEFMNLEFQRIWVVKQLQEVERQEDNNRIEVKRIWRPQTRIAHAYEVPSRAR